MTYCRFSSENGFTSSQSHLFLSFVREVFEKCMILNESGSMATSHDAAKLFYDLMVRIFDLIGVLILCSVISFFP